jgi:ABC-type uncharacterized transport system permease subunit
MDTTTTIGTTIPTNIDELSNATSTFTISNGLLVWTFIIIACLVVVVCLLTWLLFRREKVLQLMAFSISATGLKLTYELNKEEKLRLLAEDNVALRNEIKILKAALDKEKFSSLRMVIAFVFVSILFFILAKLNFSKTDKPTDTDKGEKSGI